MRFRFKHLLFAAWIAAIALAPLMAIASPSDGDIAAPQNLHDLSRSWEWAPGIVICLTASGLGYALGLWRTWRAAGTGHGIRKWEAACFAGGWLTLFLALTSPLHPLGEILFSAHMVQHELLMLIAAPLLVLGRPMVGFLRALPAPAARALGRWSNRPLWVTTWGAISNPFAAWLIHLIVLWGWHAPVLFQATLSSDWVHAAQHLCFVASALLFWWALIHGHRGVKNDGVAVLYLFTTAIHSGLLGALLTFSHSGWYPAYDQTAVWGWSQLEDQQLGGLIMWVPACTVYIIAALAFAARWLGQSDQQTIKWQRALTAEKGSPS